MGMGMVGPSQEAIDSAVDFQGPRKRRGTVGSAFNWDLHCWAGNALGLAGSLTAVYQIMQAILKSRNRKMCSTGRCVCTTYYSVWTRRPVNIPGMSTILQFLLYE